MWYLYLPNSICLGLMLLGVGLYVAFSKHLHRPLQAAGYWANTAAPSDPQELPLQPTSGSLTNSNCIQSSHKDGIHMIFSTLQFNTLSVKQQSYTSTFHRLWDSILNNICEVHRNVIISSKAHAEMNTYLLRTGLALNVQQTKGIEHWRLVIKEKKNMATSSPSCVLRHEEQNTEWLLI